MVQMGGGGFSLCVSNSENCKQTDHIDCKGSNFMGYKWMEIYWILMRVLYRCTCGYYYYYCLCNVAALLAFVVQNQTFSLHF